MRQYFFLVKKGIDKNTTYNILAWGIYKGGAIYDNSKPNS